MKTIWAKIKEMIWTAALTAVVTVTTPLILAAFKALDNSIRLMILARQKSLTDRREILTDRWEILTDRSETS